MKFCHATFFPQIMLQILQHQHLGMHVADITPNITPKKSLSDKYKPWAYFRNLTLRVATKLENMENLENSRNSKNCQNLRENSGILIFAEKPGKLREIEKYMTRSPTKMHSVEFSSLKFLREKF